MTPPAFQRNIMGADIPLFEDKDLNPLFHGDPDRDGLVMATVAEEKDPVDRMLPEEAADETLPLFSRPSPIGGVVVSVGEKPVARVESDPEGPGPPGSEQGIEPLEKVSHRPLEKKNVLSFDRPDPVHRASPLP